MVYVLARAGQANLSDLRYFSDTKGEGWKSAIAASLTGAAAAQAGDRSRASFAFGRAREILMGANPADYPDTDYGSFVRDLAGRLGDVLRQLGETLQNDRRLARTINRVAVANCRSSVAAAKASKCRRARCGSTARMFPD